MASVLETAQLALQLTFIEVIVVGLVATLLAALQQVHRAA